MAQSSEAYGRARRSFIATEADRRMMLMDQDLDREVAEAIAQAIDASASLEAWRGDGHERGQRYVDTGVCSCPRCADPGVHDPLDDVEAPRAPQGDAGQRTHASRPPGHAARVLARSARLVRQRRWVEGSAWCALVEAADMLRVGAWAVAPWSARDLVAGGTCPDFGASDVERLAGVPAIFMVDK